MTSPRIHNQINPTEVSAFISTLSSLLPPDHGKLCAGGEQEEGYVAERCGGVRPVGTHFRPKGPQHYRNMPCQLHRLISSAKKVELLKPAVPLGPVHVQDLIA
ncbi:unnamed protein product [Pleuronectes platessa]|uniref:Uncharacterized protein n=1 Tax=Pleuronectes platessa TaxID=8262 RepID=A0A9N7Z3J6_PLEPL|nr:unnamed protein product [Pleuronectes platessa]